MKDEIKKWLPLIVPGAIALAVVAFFVFLFVIKFLWAWTIPTIFPGAVEQGLIVGTLDWWGAFKLAIFMCLLSIFGWGGGCSGGKKSKDDSCCEDWGKEIEAVFEDEPKPKKPPARKKTTAKKPAKKTKKA